MRRRIIPAHAGKRPGQHSSGASCGDHPRSCGEKGRRYIRIKGLHGSSPLMRGKVVDNSFNGLCIRIIPACAGKRSYPCRSHEKRRNHPRLCGEKFWLTSIRLARCGSSPLMRGKVQSTHNDTDRIRIIPAHAGKSGYDAIYRQQMWDHPRSCGEKGFVVLAFRAIAGSSPLMRGKVSRHHHCRSFHRIIPAHAGKRCCAPPSPVWGGDHPRSCGEKT